MIVDMTVDKSHWCKLLNHNELIRVFA